MEKPTTRRKLPSYIRWILWVLLVQLILINISAAFYAYKLTHFYTDQSLRNNQTSSNIFSKTWRLFTGPHQLKSVISEYPGFLFDTVQLRTESGLLIDGWYARTDSLAKGTVLLFHAITSDKAMVLSEAYEFRYLGYNVLLVDFRAHGNSQGNTTTIGVREAEEVKLAYDFITKKGEKNIYCWGTSMGAVVVSKAVADYDLHPTGLILEMPFASLQSYLKNKARELGFPEQPFGFLVASWIGIERGFNGFNHKTTTYARKINCPVLMQWGALDQFVLKDETQKVFDAIAATDKKLVIYDHSAHESLAQNQPLQWRIEVSGFLNKHTP